MWRRYQLEVNLRVNILLVSLQVLKSWKLYSLLTDSRSFVDYEEPLCSLQSLADFECLLDSSVCSIHFQSWPSFLHPSLQVIKFDIDTTIKPPADGNTLLRPNTNWSLVYRPMTWDIVLSKWFSIQSILTQLIQQTWFLFRFTFSWGSPYIMARGSSIRECWRSSGPYSAIF